MGKGTSKSGVIAMLTVVIIILVTLCILFATGTINFKNKEEYFQFYKEYEDNVYTLYELKLSNGKNADYCVVKANSGSFCAKGTYTIDGNKILFSGKYYEGIAIGQDIAITFVKDRDKIYEELSEIYSMTKINKKNFKQIKD